MTSRPTLPPDFEKWLADHPDVTPDDLAPPWRLTEGADPLCAAPAPDPARIQAIQATLAKTAANGTGNAAPRPALRLVKRPRRVQWMAAAAVVVVLVLAGIFFRQQPLTISAPAGEIAMIDLPDGSLVELQGGSTLTYARRFDARTRRARLDGEAFFEVTKAGTPFVIETFNATVTVLGTSFNVRAWPDTPEAETVVFVETGLVEVTTKQATGDAIRLAAGEAARVAAVDDASSPQAAAAPDAAYLWRDDLFFFFDQPLGVMFDEIEQHFDIEIIASESIRSQTLTIKTDVTTAEALIAELCKTPKTMTLRYRLTANGFEIFEE